MSKMMRQMNQNEPPRSICLGPCDESSLYDRRRGGDIDGVGRSRSADACQCKTHCTGSGRPCSSAADK
ncbi:hypothetical protein ZHAS_00007583 [Anopheles sinensis]|uniref:Uncharacterized protein n=1 Tax=Anopheles sinensis TaxID=74873 RepID=A0A084VQG4_ANOSI|nr:hypothetical protein ZHAS_00007583 [Anopheles sinensis]